MKKSDETEAQRLERLWAGEFGQAYVERNRAMIEHRLPYWRDLLTEYPAKSVLEVGCNIGGNLVPISRILSPRQTFGIDVNAKAIDVLRADVPGINALSALARELPFRDRWFDLTFTMGVLIHQPPEVLPIIMSEIVRTSRRFILCGEYYAETPTEIPYRGEKGALFKRDFGGLYQQLFPELVLRKKSYMNDLEAGWDDITLWVFEKP